MKQSYDDSKVQYWFQKEKDFILWTKDSGDPIMAGLFLPYKDAEKYVWMEKSTCRVIAGKDITHYMVIPE